MMTDDTRHTAPGQATFSLRGVRAFVDGRLRRVDIDVTDGIITAISPARGKAAGTPTASPHLWLLPGVIDVHVHFRDPGLTHKADIATESLAAAAGGVTTVLDMPNVVPPTTTPQALEQKRRLFGQKCVVNYGIFYGITADNIEEALTIPQDRICGYKVFLGSSTGGMLLTDRSRFYSLLQRTSRVIAVHAEHEPTIVRNRQRLLDEASRQAGHPVDDLPLSLHSAIRSRRACRLASLVAVHKALTYGANLHLCHISTAEELDTLAYLRSDEARRRFAYYDHSRGGTVTGEACVAHLWFTDRDYDRLGTRIKCNPSVKTLADRTALRKALRPGGAIDIVATDHAPHLPSEKQGGALKAASGMPGVQFSLLVMLELVRRGVCSLADVVRLMCRTPARRFGLTGAGSISVGNRADFVLVDTAQCTTVTPDIIISKCGWSPFEGETFHARVMRTWVCGKVVYDACDDTQGRTCHDTPSARQTR